MRTAFYFSARAAARRMLFDGQIAGICFERFRDGPKALAMMREFIKHERVGDHLIPLASQAMLEDPVDRGRVAFVPDVMRYLREPDLIHQMRNAKRFNPHNKDGTFRRQAKIAVGDYEWVATRAVRYLCTCDPEAIRRVLSSVRAIGPQRARGGGEIAYDEIQIETVAAKPFFGALAGKHVLRPIPMAAEIALRDAVHGDLVGYRDIEETCSAPYHDNTNRVPCLTPQYQGLEWVVPQKQFVQMVTAA